MGRPTVGCRRLVASGCSAFDAVPSLQQSLPTPNQRPRTTTHPPTALPAHPAAYTRASHHHRHPQNVLARGLMVAFSEALGLPRHTLLDMFGENDMGTIRLIYYPGNENSGAGGGVDSGADGGVGGAADEGIGAHTDFEAFTLMHQAAR